MKFLLFICLSISLFGQNNIKTKEKHILVELSAGSDFSKRMINKDVVFGAGLWYRFPIEENARLELGGSFKYSKAKYQFVYGKNGIVYDVTSDIADWNLGGRMVKSFRIKNTSVEWVSELTLDNMFFDGKDIEDSPPPKSAGPTTYVVVVDVESIATLRLAQGIRFWIGDFAIMPRISYSPYGLLYRNTVPTSFNKVSVDIVFAIKL